MRIFPAWIYVGGLGLWCLTPLLAICLLCRSGQFYWWKKTEYSVKTNDLSQIIEKFEFITAVLIGTDGACSCNSNYQKTTTVPSRYIIVIILCKLQSCSIKFSHWNWQMVEHVLEKWNVWGRIMFLVII